MEIRRSVLALGIGLALYGSLLAAAAGLTAGKAGDTAPAGGTLTLQTAEAALPGKEEGYLLRTVQDEVCVFRDGQLLLHTGVMASLLPRQDREALEAGLTVADQAALTALLEDLGS